MKVTITDSRNEERRVQRTRELPGHERTDWTSHSGREGEYRNDADNRQVSVWFEDGDYDELGVPRVDQGRRAGKHDGQFFVAKVNVNWARGYSYKDGNWTDDRDPEETERGWGRASLVVSGSNRLATGGEGVKSNSTSYPKVHEVDDETRPYTFANWKAQLSYATELAQAQDIETLDQLRKAVAEHDDKGKSYNRHPLAYTLGKIEQGERGMLFFTKRVVDPLPDYLAKLVQRLHPATGELPFSEPEEHRYGVFPDKRTATV